MRLNRTYYVMCLVAAALSLGHSDLAHATAIEAKTVAQKDLTTSTTNGTSVKSDEASPQARPTMQKFSENLSILMQNIDPFDNNPSKDQRNAVIQALAELKGLSHNVQATMALYSVDPVMRYLSFDLPKQFARIEAAYTTSNYPHSRYLLRQTTQYCIGCHASSANKNSVALEFAEPLSRMSDIEKAEYFSATRRHEKAMLIYEKVLSDHKFKIAQPELWEKSLQNLVAITMRIRNDPRVTLEIISALAESGSHLPAQKELLATWRSSAKAWIQEPKLLQATGPQRLISAEQLIEKGDNLAKLSANFGYIEYMRAMIVLNELSMSQEPDAIKAKGFLLTGQTSEKLSGHFVWMHPEAYYEACIRSKPHSLEAKESFKMLKQFAVKQSAQVFEASKLQELEWLAR